VGDNTYPNVMALLTGQLAEERPFGAIDLTPFLWKDFSENGYRTLQVEDSFIENHVFNIAVDNTNSPGGFRSVPTDYYFRPLSVAMHAHHKLLDRRPKEFRLCTGPELEDELILNWVSLSRLLIFSLLQFPEISFVGTRKVKLISILMRPEIRGGFRHVQHVWPNRGPQERAPTRGPAIFCNIATCRK